MNVDELAAAIKAGSTRAGRLTVDRNGPRWEVRLVRGDGTPGPVIFGPGSAEECAAFSAGFNAGVASVTDLD